MNLFIITWFAAALFKCALDIHAFFCWRRALSAKRPATDQLPPLTIVICARNEADQLRRNLPAVLGQDYPELSYIIVNDRSTDGTALVLEEFEMRESRLRVIQTDESLVQRLPGKRAALKTAMKAVETEWVLLTDADCYPLGADWAKLMMQQGRAGVDIILGLSPYEKYKGLLNSMIRIETFNTAFQYIYYASRGTPYMGLGRNLAYRTTVFNRAEQSEAYSSSLSGDDDLLVSATATADNTAVCVNCGAQIISHPQSSWKSWFNQKIRHLSASRAYSERHKGMLAFHAMLEFVFWWGGIALLGMGQLGFGFIAMAWAVVMIHIGTRLQAKSSARFQLHWIYLVVLQPLYLLYLIITGLTSFTYKGRVWK